MKKCKGAVHQGATLSFVTSSKVKVDEDVVRFTIERVLHDVPIQLKVVSALKPHASFDFL